MTRKTSVTDALRDMLLSGRFAGGQPLTEIALSKLLSVSRTPVREALTALEAEGLVSPRGTRGFCVRQFSDDDQRKARDIQSALEGLAGRLAAERGLSNIDLAALNACLADGEQLCMQSQMPSDQSFEHLDTRFHSIIVRAANNPRLEAMIAENGRLLSAATLAMTSARSADASGENRKSYHYLLLHGQHVAIVQALRDRQAWRLGALLNEHLITTY